MESPTWAGNQSGVALQLVSILTVQVCVPALQFVANSDCLGLQLNAPSSRTNSRLDPQTIQARISVLSSWTSISGQHFA